MNPGKKSRIVLFTSAIAALAGLLLGYDTGSISGALGFIADAFRLDTVGKGSVISIVLVGGILGALINGIVADRLGRKLMVQAAALIFIAGAAASALSPRRSASPEVRPGLALGRFPRRPRIYSGDIPPQGGGGSTLPARITIG
jgi:MFS family permease